MGHAIPWSPYDAAVPHTVGLAGARVRFDALRPARRPPVEDPLGSVREVVAVVSSSRGGSTLFGAILRRCNDLVHLRAEVNPLFVVAGLDGRGDVGVLADELAAEMGNRADTVGEEELHDLSLAVAWRLTAQWPELDVDPDDARRWAEQAAAGLGGRIDREFHLRVLDQARCHLPGINPYYYDLPRDLVARRFPDAPPPSGPPAEQLVEMPPFVLVPPWRRAGRADLEARPLVLSTPRNAFRLPFLRQLFRSARFRVIHLTRNPAASINGLIDGWLHHGFFNVAVDEPLRIGGYSDTFPEWGERWWCYDFPPAWRELTDATLPQVCGEQWRSHHDAVLGFLEGSDVDAIRVRFEDVTGPRRAEVFAELDDWLGTTGTLSAVASEHQPSLMATAPPRPRRWEPRAQFLAPVLASEALAEMTTLLDYEDPSTWA